MQLKEMYAQMVYKDNKIVELNERVTEQDQVIIDMQELVSEKDEVIRGRDMAIQLLQSTVTEQSMRLRDQESLVARLSAKVERAEIELNAFHERLESDVAGEEQKLFANHLKTIQENFAELLTKKDDEIVKLRQQMAQHDESLSAGAVVDVTAELDSAAGLPRKQLHHNQDDTSLVGIDSLLLTTRLQELEAEVEELKESLRNKDDKLASSTQQLESLRSELQQLHKTVATSSDVSVYSTASDTSVEVPGSRVHYDESSCLVSERRKEDVDVSVPETDKQTDRQVFIVRCRPTCVLEISANELQQNLAFVDDACIETEESQLTEADELQRLNEEMLLLHSLLEAKEAELEKLREEISQTLDELAKKEQECTELTQCVASLSESDTVLKQQLAESAFQCEELRKELSRDETAAEDGEQARLSVEISGGSGQFAEKELSDLSEENRCVKIETENLSEASEKAAARRSRHALQSGAVAFITDLPRQSEEESEVDSQRVDNLSTEVTEVKKLHEEVNSLLAENTMKFEELSQTGTLTEGKSKDLEKFSADLDSVRAKASEKQQRLESMIQALNAKDADVSESLREIVSLRESLSQLKTSLHMKEEEAQQQKVGVVEHEIKEQVSGTKSWGQISEVTESVASCDEPAAIVTQQLAESPTTELQQRSEEDSRRTSVERETLSMDIVEGKKLNSLSVEKTTRVEELCRENDLLRDAVTKYQNTEQELKSHIEMLAAEKSKELIKLNTDLDLVRAEASEKEERLESVIQALYEKDADVSESLRKIESLSETVSQLRTSLNTKDGEIEQQKVCLVEHKTKIKEQVSDLKNCYQKISQLTDSIASFTESATVFTDQLAESTYLCEELRNELMADKDQIKAKDSELEKLREQILSAGDELAKKEEDCKELAASVESLSQTAGVLKDQLSQSEFSLEEFRTELHKEVEEKVVEIEKLQGKLSASHEQLETRDGEWSELSSVTEECRHLRVEKESLLQESEGEISRLRVEKESLLQESEREISRLNNLVLTLETSHAELHATVAELQKKSEDSRRSSEEVETLSMETVEVKKLYDETNSLLAEKTKRLEDLSQECAALRETLQQHKCTEQELTSQIETLMEDRGKDLEKFNADLDLVRAEASEKQERLESMMQALSEKETFVAGSQSEIESLTETISQLQTSIQSKTEENELLRSEALQQAQHLESMTQALSEKEDRIADSVREIQSLTVAVSHLQNKDQEIELLRSGAVEKDSQLEGLVQALSEKDANIAGSLREIESLAESVSQLKASTQSKDEEIDRLQDQVSAAKREVREKEEEYSAVTESVAGWSEADSVLRQQLTESQLSCQELRSQLTKSTDQIEASALEQEKLQDEITSSRHELVEKEDSCNKLSSLLEESRRLVVEKDSLVEQSRVEVSELKRQLEEIKSLLAEKLARFEELSQECGLLQEAVENHKIREHELVIQTETLAAGRENDLQKFNADLDSLRTEIADKDHQLEGISQALSEENVKTAGSLKEIESLKETISQLESLIVNKDNEIKKQECILAEQEADVKEQSLEIKSCNERLEEHQVMKSEFVNQLSAQQDDIKSLTDKLAQSELLCEQLRGELTEVKDHIAGTEAELEQLRTAVLTSRDELTSKEDDCKELTCLLEESRTLGVEKDRLLAEKTTEFEVLSQECDLLRDSVVKYQDMEQQLLAQIQTISECKENELQKINAELDLARAQASAKEQQVEDMIQALSEKDTNITETVREIQSSSETVSNLQMLLQNKDQEIDLLKVGAQEQGQQLEAMIQELTEKDANIAGSQREMESLTETVSELQTSLVGKDEQIEQQKLLIQEHEMKISEQDAEIKSCYQKLEEHEVMKTEFVNQLSVQEGMIKSLKEELAGSGSRTEDTLRHLKLLETEMTGKDDKISELSDVVAGLNESGDVLTEQLAKSEFLCEELRNELVEVRVQIEGKEAELDKLQALVSTGRDELVEKEEYCSDMAKSATSLNESSTVLREKLTASELMCEELRNEVTKGRVEFETKEVELEKLREQISASRDESAKKDDRCNELSDLLEKNKGLVEEKDDLLGKYSKEVEELSRQNKDTSALLAEKMRQFENLSQEYHLLKDTVEKYKNTEQELTSRVEMLVEGKENDLRKSEADLQLLKNELLERDRQLEDAARQIDVLNSEMIGRDEVSSNLKESAVVLREELVQSQLTCEELRNELAEDRHSLEARNAELETSQDSVSAVRVELAQKEEECKELSQLLKNSREQLDELESLKSDFETKEVELEKLRGAISASHTELTTKEEECRDLTESVACLNDSISILTQQLAESRLSCEELKNEMRQDRGHIEVRHADLDKTDFNESSTSCDQSASLVEENRSPRLEKQSLLETSSLEVAERLPRVEISEEYVYSEEKMALHAYDVVECVRPRYNVVSETNLSDRNVADAMKHWAQFCDLLTKINTELEQTKSLSEQFLTIESEEPPFDSHSTIPSHENDFSHPDDSAAALLPFAVLTTMSENVKAIRHHIEHQKCKTLTDFPPDDNQDVDSFRTQLSKQCRILDERNQELEAARLEIETSTLRFEKLKARSIAKIKEVSQKHQVAVEQKDEELSELQKKLQQQEHEMVSLTAKLEASSREVADTEERCLTAHNRREELEMLLADKNAQIMAMLDQMDGKEFPASVDDISVEASVAPAVVENLTEEEMQRTDNIDSSCLSPERDEDVECGTSKTAGDVDALRSVLLNTGQILDDLLSTDDSYQSPSTSRENDFSYVEVCAEQCRKLISDLQTTSKLKETELLAVNEQLEEKKVLASKYAAAAKKLKQQLEKSKKDSSEISDQLKHCEEQTVELTSQLSALQQQHAQKEAELDQLQLSVEVMKESDSCSREEINNLKEVNEKLEAELELQMREIEELKSEVDNRNQMELTFNKAKEDLSQLLRQKDAELSKLSAEAEADSTKLAETELLLRQKDAELSELSAEADANATRLVELEQTVRQKDEELSQLFAAAEVSKAKLVHLEQTLESHTAQLDTMSTANQELKNLLHFNDKETGELMESNAATMQQLVTELSHTQDKFNKKTSELDQMVAENRELMRRIDEKEDEIRQCNNSIVALKQEIEDLESELLRQREQLKQNSDDLANLSSVHESDLSALEESQEQLSALQKELNEKRGFEVEAQQKSCEMEAKLHTVCEELNRERSLSDKYRSECEDLTAALRDKVEQLNCLSDQLHNMDDKVRNYEVFKTELEQQLAESSAKLCALESDLKESVACQQQLAEAQRLLEQKDRELALLTTNVTELSAQLDTTSMLLDKAVEDAGSEKVESSQSRDRNVMMAAAFVQTDDTTITAEMSATVAQTVELTELNSQLSAEVMTLRNRLADLEVENCSLRNMSPKVDTFFTENTSSSVTTTESADIYRHDGDGSVVENNEVSTCQLSQLGPVEGGHVTERLQGHPEGLELRPSDELSSLKEKYLLLESSHARLEEELLTERQNSSRFMSIEKLKEGLEAENEKNVAQVEALMATKQKMLAKLKQLKATNDSLVGQVEDLKQQLQLKSTQLSNLSRMESEVKKLTGCLTALEDEKKNWLSVEEGYKVMVSSLREEMATLERNHEDKMNKRLEDLRAAADAEKCSLKEQVNSVRDELRGKIVDYESQLSTVGLEKNSLETSLSEVKKGYGGREEVLKQKLADLQTLHDAALSDTDSYQQLLDQLTADNTRLEELLRTRSETVDELRDEINTLRSQLAEVESQKEELKVKYHELVEEQTSTETELQNMEQVKRDFDSARNKNVALLEEIEGLNWKIQGLSEVEQELTELQSEMFEIQSENGMLKKRLSFVEKEAAERSGNDERCSHLVEQLSEEKQKLVVHVEHLESQVNFLRAQLDAKPSVECEDAEVQCGEERSESLESELEKLREHCLLLEDENAHLQRSEERQRLGSQREEIRDEDRLLGAENGSEEGHDEMAKSVRIELEELRQRCVFVESENTRLKSVIEGMKSDSEQLLHEKVVARRAGISMPLSAESARRQRGSHQTTQHSFKQHVSSFHVIITLSCLV